ncbi:MAG TPA: hypothetical protein VEP90_29745 [Methylomirabilota bacterium]|nr:hypothetical protein [Methylomirabilota bacterium]
MAHNIDYYANLEYLEHLGITSTYEPLRPIYAPDDSDPFYYVTLGQARVFYGESWWPSKSYLMIPGEFYVDSRGDWKIR